MMNSTSGAYVCRNCLARGRVLGRFYHAANRRVRPADSLRASSLARGRHLATVYHSNAATQPPAPRSAATTASGAPDESIDHDALPYRPIRERLAEFVPKELPKNVADALAAMADYSPLRGTNNDLFKPRSLATVELEDDSARDDGSLFDSEDAAGLDLGLGSTDIAAGDLVEVRTETWRVQLLAVCLGNFNGCDHFYTNTGKWFTSPGYATMFAVRNFVDPWELKPVIEALPSTVASEQQFNVLQELGLGPSRDVGARLIRKMNEFAEESREVHVANASLLDNAFQLLNKTGQGRRHMTLHDLAEVLLRNSRSRPGKLSPAALYAVHRAVMADDVCFRPLSQLGRGRTYLFEVSAPEDLAIIRSVESTVREFYEIPDRILGPLHDKVLKQYRLGSFIINARKAIDRSRKCRQWSPYGVLSPSLESPPRISYQWTDADLEVLQFMHLWASYDRFSSSSRLHGIGAAILRALERYEETDFLTMSTGWTFLQEVGWITPWDIQSRYEMALADIPPSRIRGFIRPPAADSDEPVLREDVFAESRKDWGDVMAYCIDAASTVDVDDAVSLERTDKPGEFWVHVHVADPASRIPPESPLARQAELLPQTSYLEGHFERMFPDDVVREEFSLAPDRPCLTFSARVTEQGVVLDSKITPGTLRRVVYITPEEVAAICGDSPSQVHLPSQEPFEVGSPPTSDEYPLPDRKMTTAADLASQDLADLKTLDQLAKALHSARLAKGALPVFLPRAAAKVSLEGTEVTEDSSGFLSCRGDPYIRVSYEDTNGSLLVKSAMQLAGEIAAEWCHARGIPIPYRTQPVAARNTAQLRALADSVYPQLLGGQRPSDAEMQAMRRLIGPDVLAAAPAPHFVVGADKYAKVTSPLRRYADLVAHWQIEAALLEEEQRGASLVRGEGEEGEDPDNLDYLPFNRQELEDDVLPMLHLRERTMRVLDGSRGRDQWILQALVRAWKFGGSGSDERRSRLPDVFRFTVGRVVPRQVAFGTLDWFDRRAVLEAAHLAGSGLTLDGLAPGDVLEVELAHVDVHAREVLVKALRRV